ncbi:glycosyltransferase family 2 protein [Frankia sp. Cppng1_Ct_nod]|uniref:glycosyltransferase family 2 protein n=1 Tax=Frankia sp. Cppng1_Ct_nod TaxID=2897162 RepID=UPI001F5F6871|nr:glycosyltransferase family 2 protein [Frankia sp. Cppng1_Ct_nod]
MKTRQGRSVAAVIVHWGPAQPSVELAGWLTRCEHVSEVVVVANNRIPRPESLEASVKWLVPHRNLGFAGAFDTAVCEHPGYKTYILLNNDVRLSRETVEACLVLLSAGDIGVVAPALYNDNGLQSGLGTISNIVMEPRIHRTGTGAVDAAWVTGAVMFIKASCYKEVGFDRRFFLGGEDVDFCLRVRRAGWRVVITFSNRAWHLGGSTIPSNGFLYYAIRNRLWLVRLHGGRLRHVAAGFRIGAVLLVRTLVADLVKRRSLIRTRLAVHGLVDGMSPMPRSNEPWPDEPRASRWLESW